MNIGDKVTFHYGRPGEVKPYPATIVEIWPPETIEVNGTPQPQPQALVLDVVFTQDVLDSGIAPRQGHSIETKPDAPESGGWTP